MKKKIIYGAAAALVLALGIIIGIVLSKGGDDETPEGNTPNTLVQSNGTEGDKSSEPAGSGNSGNGKTAEDPSDVKASDIGQPIMPGGKDNNTESVGDENKTEDGTDTPVNDGNGTDTTTPAVTSAPSGNGSGTDTGKTDGKDTPTPIVTGTPDDKGTADGTDIGTGTGDTDGDDTPTPAVTDAPDDTPTPAVTDAPDDTETGKGTDTETGTGKTDGDDDTGEIKKPGEVIIAKPVAVIDTGKLTEKGSGYEGTKGTGKYNYGEALQKSVLFYELQRSGKLPDKVRCNWRGDSALNDGKDNGVDLTGGWYDAGDNVKFNLPMSYTSSMLGWSIIDDAKAYEESGQLAYALGNIKWANDYFIKCHPSDEVYYYQVGDGNQDHSYWGAAETVEYRMSRPSYKVTKSSPGSAVCGETAASLAISSIIYKNIDKSYSDLCLKHAKSLYKFARDTKSDAGYTAANGFYNSWSGFYDELAWSGAWLYCATGDETYITNAEADYKNA